MATDAKTAGSRNSTAKRLLVLDGDMVPALTIVRSLGRRYVVDIASSKERPIAAYSRRSMCSFVYPDPLESEQAFLDWIEAHTSSHHYDLVVPVTERSLVPLSRHRERFGSLQIAMAPRESLDLVLDKSATFDLAAELGVSVPESHLVEHLEDLKTIEEHLQDWPVVLKPIRSVAHSGVAYTKHSVSYAHNLQELQRDLARLLRLTPVVLQSYFVGIGVGVEVIAQQGEILYAFQHQRIHEVPLSGGGSSYRKSTELAPELLSAAQRLIKALAWQGVAMVEFKWQPSTGEYRLMEINGRFWGSLPLAQAAGVDFPGMLAELELDGCVSDRQHYRRDIYCRNLARDLTWLEQVLRGDADSIATVPSIKTALKDSLQIFSPKHYFDVQSISDPVPGLIDMWRVAKGYAVRLTGLFCERWFTATQRLSWRNGTVSEKLRSAGSVLFICYGNINRSALAEVLWTGKYGRVNPQVISAGFHQEASRSMDPRMAAVAAGLGFSVESFASTTVTEAVIAASDVVFVMEKLHYDRILEIHPQAKGRVFLLGAGLGPKRCPSGEIGDPYGRDEASYRRCFDLIDASVTRLVTELGANTH